MNSSTHRPYTAMLIVPTGVGAAIGGYAGDAMPVARAISQVVDRLITHPNVMNGAQLYWPLTNTLYVEGYGLDQMAAGDWGLRPVQQNKIGLVLDQAIEPELKLRHLQVADAARATLGLNLTDYVTTDAPLGVELRTASSGATWGTIERPDSLLRAVEKLRDAKAEAIAVVVRFPDDEGSEALQHYRQGQGVDPLSGAEAVISHLVVRNFRLPCAHAPALLPLPIDPSLSPRSAAEELGHTFLPCVLVGLSRAPQFIQRHQRPQSQDIWADQIDALILPATACGGSAALSLSQSKTQIITVRANATRLNVTAQKLGMQVIAADSYLEAVGLLAAHRAGVHPGALSPHMSQIQALKVPTLNNLEILQSSKVS